MFAFICISLIAASFGAGCNLLYQLYVSWYRKTRSTKSINPTPEQLRNEEIEDIADDIRLIRPTSEEIFYLKSVLEIQTSINKACSLPAEAISHLP